MSKSEGIPSRFTERPTLRAEKISRGPARGSSASATGWRTALLALGALSAAVAGTTLSVWSLSAVNLDHLLDAPVSFYGLLVLPSALALLLLTVPILPRTLLINLAVFAGLLVCAETAARALMSTTAVVQGEPEAIGGRTFYVPDASLGYTIAPSIEAHHRRTASGRDVYNVTYQIDERGRRRTPMTPARARRSFLLFFGDSNTFGEGLSQTDTLPFHAGELTARYRPYNYGVPGYGPQHMLELLKVRRLAEEVPEPDGYAVFFVIPSHIARLIGSSTVSTGWGRHFPYYHLESDGSLVATGDFVHGRPFTTLAYHFWSKSSLASALSVDLPPRYREQDYRLAAKILGEAGRQLARQVRIDGFYVILGQAYNDPQLQVLEELRRALAREGVACLDYARLLDLRDPRYRLSEFDAHNSGQANRAIAARLISDLRIGR